MIRPWLSASINWVANVCLRSYGLALILHALSLFLTCFPTTDAPRNFFLLDFSGATRGDEASRTSPDLILFIRYSCTYSHASLERNVKYWWPALLSSRLTVTIAGMFRNVTAPSSSPI